MAEQIEVEITIGGRSFDVACQRGEERYLQAAAAMLDIEAQVLVDQIGRMPESRMLLMAGLMLADKTAGLEERLREAEAALEAREAEIEALQAASNRPGDADGTQDDEQALERLAQQAEALAAELEDKRSRTLAATASTGSD